MRSRHFANTMMIGVLLFTFLAPLHAEYTLESPFTFSFYHRFRIETWDNAVSLNDQAADAMTYTRNKTSVGLLWKTSDNLEIFGKLSNEFRVYLAPKGRTASSEIFVDNLYVRWNQKGGLPFVLTVGRQDIHLGEGFIVMDGQASSGSRSFYFNAVRLDLTPWENHTLTLYFGHVPRTDNLMPVVRLTDVDDQILEEQAYRSIGAYYAGTFPFAKIDAYFVRKDTDRNEWQPIESHLNTFGGRMVGRFSDQLTLTGEAAIQTGTLQDTSLAGEPSLNASGFGGQAHIDYSFIEETPFFRTLSIGGIYLTGDDPSTPDKVEAWNPVHSRWPKWSESYIYTLIPENRVAYWSNLNAVYLTLSGKIMENLGSNLSFYSLGAQHPVPVKTFPGGIGKSRGSLLIGKLLMTFSKQLSGHFVWEHFIPGDFYFSSAADYNWLRFELLLKL